MKFSNRCLTSVLLSACLVGSSHGQEGRSLFFRDKNIIFNILSGDPQSAPLDPEDSFGTRANSFGPCLTTIGAGKCLSKSDAFYNACRKNDITLEDCQASVSKLSEAVGIDYDTASNTCFALFPGVGLTKEDLVEFCPNADEVIFYYPETLGFPVDGQSNVASFECFKCTRT